MTSILEMPDLVMENIIGLSDFKAVLTLRQVCRDFRNFIDDLKDSQLPKSEIEYIEIMIYENKIKFSFCDAYMYTSDFEYSQIENSRTFEAEENPERKTTTDLGNSNIVGMDSEISKVQIG
ncbi:hypothetical protein B9Z55_021220 [Caenorhabditis nigoni]|uniref:F-box domain-containing protein n=1 Tax=Caenorhabditis nigoni TaxID=1611254 RepID=A0A2G5TRL6_9PELO|nr:hypothetical protein B9Z55_021220 [Caenorhabditis nigoni]